MDYRILLWIACLSLNFWSSAENKNTTIAGYVNEEVITKTDVYQLSRDANLNYEQALNQLIEQHLVLQDFHFLILIVVYYNLLLLYHKAHLLRSLDYHELFYFGLISLMYNTYS